MFITFYTTRLTLQVLGDEDYGINNVIGGLISMFAVVSMPITSALQRYFNVEFAKREIPATVVFNTSLRVIGVIVIVMMLLYETVGLYLVNEVIQYPQERESAVHIIFQLTAVNAIISFVMVPYTAFLFSKENMGVPAAAELVGSVCKLLFLVAIPYIPSDSLVLYSLSMLAFYALQLIFFVVYCRRRYTETRFVRTSDRNLGSSIMKFAGWNSIEAVAGLAITYLSNIIVNVFGGVLYNSAYGLGKSLNTAIASLTNNLVKAVEPQITCSVVVADDSYRNGLVLTTIKLAMLCVGFIVIFFHFSGQQFLVLWLGDVPKYAYEFCSVMIVSTLFGSVVLPLRSMIIATGRIQWYFTMYGVLSAVSLVTMYLLLRAGMPIVTAVVLVAACSAAMFVTAVVTAVRVTTLRLSDVMSTIARSVASLAATFVVYGVTMKVVADSGIVGTVASVVVALAALVLTTYYVAMDAAERKMVGKAYKKIKNNRKI